jgi:HSP20 family protein
VAETSTHAAADLAEDARKLLVEIDKQVPGASALSADCRPPVDIIETATSIEVVMDIAGVPADAIRIVVRRDTLLIVGAKVPTALDGQARFHLAERAYGQFARALRLGGAFDASRGRATIQSGLLRIALPRLADRRGQLLTIPVERA